MDDREYKSTYCIVEANIRLQRYVATIMLKPVTDGKRSFWHWESSFDTPPGRERELRDMVAQGVYEAGFENLHRYLRHGWIPPLLPPIERWSLDAAAQAHQRPESRATSGALIVVA